MPYLFDKFSTIRQRYHEESLQMSSVPDNRSNGHYVPLAERIGNAWKLEEGKLEQYRQAERQELRVMMKITIAMENLVVLMKVLLMSSFLVLKTIFRLFFPRALKDIRGQLALVSGGGNGLGRAIAFQLVRCGARVAIADLDSRAAQATAKELCELTGNDSTAKAFISDVSSLPDVKTLHDEIVAEFGVPVDILVNNAGLIPPVSLINGSDDDINRIIDVNLKSHFWMLRAFLPSMQSRNSGHIVTIASLAGIVGLSRAVAYTATKHALRGMSTALLYELRDDGLDGVRVTIAYPWFLLTRKDLIDNLELSMPAMHPDEAAGIIVDGMRRNYVHVGAPTFASDILTLLNIFPEEVQELCRNSFKTEIKK